LGTFSGFEMQPLGQSGTIFSMALAISSAPAHFSRFAYICQWTSSTEGWARRLAVMLSSSASASAKA
jgi:hypothetical protein